MRRLPLADGRVALVDDDAPEWIFFRRWSVSNHCYVATYEAGGRHRYLHRIVMGEPPGLYVDHINHDTLDNRRENLRVVTNAQNMQNRRGANEGSATGVRGVSWHRASGSFEVHLTVNGKKRCLGYRKTLEEAAALARAGRERLMTHTVEDAAAVAALGPVQ
jgi:HNH endonuclease/AP2 domain